jgi:hypothetical protein
LYSESPSFYSNPIDRGGRGGNKKILIMNENETLTGGLQAAPEPINNGLDKEQSLNWEKNHKKILAYVREYMRMENQTPTVADIADKTGISRPTVYKHLQSFSSTAEFAGHASIFKVMVTDVVRLLYRQCCNGNIHAARLYLETMGVLKTGKTVNNNFINRNSLKVNDIELNEDVLQTLNEEQLKQIEEIVMHGPLTGKNEGPETKPKEA